MAPTPPSGGEAHDADVEQAGIAPLDVHAERHDGGDQAQVEDGEHDLPALAEADGEQQQRHAGVEDRDAVVFEERPHTTRPRKMPVGRTSSTTTRMMKETANL